jgi:Bacterial membrane protein YfhO
MAQPPEMNQTDTLEPRHAWLLALVTCVVGTMLLAYPALSGQFLVNIYSDQYIAGYSFREFGAQVLRATGGFALWNPYLFGGMPYVGAMHGDIFYPTAFLRLAIPTDAAMTWGMIIHYMLGGFATYLFLRALGLRFFGALVGALAYMLGGWNASYVSPGHDGKIFVGAMLPLAMLCLVRGIRDGRDAAWGALAIIVGLGMLSPHPQLMSYMLMGCGIFALYLAFGQGSASPSRPVAIRRLAFALGAIVLGFAISAVQYLPVMEYTPFSPRAGGKDYAFATSYSFPPVELFNTLIPEFTGILDKYWGPNRIHHHSEYIGAAVWVLAIAAFRSRVRSRETMFWGGLTVLFTLWALGGFTPFYQIIYAVVPGSKFFRAPSTVFFMATFAVAVLAAYGAQGVLEKLPSRRFLIAAGATIAVVLLMGVTGTLTGLAGAFAAPEVSELVPRNAGDLLTGSARAMAFAAIALAIVFFRGNGKITPMVAGWALVAVVTLDLVSVMRTYWTFSAPARTTFATDAAIEYIKKSTATNPGRVIDYPIAGAGVPRDPELKYSGLMAHGIRQATGYHGNEMRRYDDLTGGEDQGRPQLLNPNYWALANVRFFLADAVPEKFPIPDAKLVAGPARDAAGSMVYLYELPGDNRAAWVAPAVIKAADSVTLATVLDPRFPVHSVAIFNDSADVKAVQLTSPPAPIDLPVAVTRYDAGAISLTLGMPAPAGSALVVSENFYPGWIATVDGKPATAARAMYSLIGVPLPAGARKVELRFTSPIYEKGKTITLFALGIATLLLGAGVVLDRRKAA